MNVVLSGYFGFHNVGDEAILQAMIDTLKAVEPNIQITVLSNDPEYTEKTYGVAAVNRWKLGEVFRALQSSDGLISGGGSLLQDETGSRSVIYYTGIMLLARAAKVPFFIYAQGMGPVRRPLNQRVIRAVLKKASGITVRDQESRRFLENIGLKKPIEVVPDPVLGFRRSDKKSAWLSERSFSTPLITVSVRDWPSSYPYKKVIAEALDDLASDGYTIVLLPMHGAHDEKTSLEIEKGMRQSVSIAPYDASIEEKISIIAESNLLIGMRLHALIFAALTTTPFIGISYDPKIDAFAEQARAPVAGHVSDKLDKEEILKLVRQQLEVEELERKRLQHFLENVRDETKRTAQIALTHLREKSH